MSSNEIVVEMAGFEIAESPQTLVARGLGSCVAISFYSRQRKIGALSHVMLPDSKESTVKGKDLRFMDRMVAEVLIKFSVKEIKPQELEAKLIGGANMFPFLNREIQMFPSMGERNVAMARALLRQNGVMIVGEEVGGHYGRSVKFHLDTGIVTVEKKI